MQDFNAEHPNRPGVTVGEDLADQNLTLAMDLIRIQSEVKKLARELRERASAWTGIDPVAAVCIADELLELVKEER